MSQFALKGFSHVRPARSRSHTGWQPATFFQDSNEQRLQQEDRLIAIGLLICFVVQGWVLLV
jgi:hypothetical protein